jgi:DNA-binding transcriptional LysR family regulator
MRLRQIETFIAVAECGSIRAAARGLGVSQPAITKSVRSLESELHAQLLQRTPHGVVLTPIGRTFFARVRAAQSEIRKAQEELAIGSDGAGTVAFGVGPVAAVLIAPLALTRFHRQYPCACIRVVEGFPPALLPLVRDGSLDFAIGPRLDSQLDPSLAFRPLFREEFAIVARKEHPLRRARALRELASAEWVDLWKSGLPNGPLGRTFAAAGLPVPRQIVQCESYNIVVSVVAKTDMLALLSRRLLALPLARDFLQEISITERSVQLTVGMFTRADSPFTQLAAAMAKAVTAETRALARSAWDRRSA